MKIDIATQDQLAIVQELAHQIWKIAYKDIISKEQIDFMLDKIYSIDSLQKQMQQGQVFLLISYKEKHIGYAAYELNFENSIETKIHKLYILPQNQSLGFGNLIIKYIENKAIFAKNSTLILNVNKYNKAFNFYTKNGFSIRSSIVLDIGNNFVMDDYIMEKLIE